MRQDAPTTNRNVREARGKILSVDNRDAGNSRCRIGFTVPYLPDLVGESLVKNVGYLWSGNTYPKGDVSGSFFDRLVAVVEKPFICSCGYHECNLGWCGLSQHLRSQPIFRHSGRLLSLGSYDVFVPDSNTVYAAPSLILHYIRHHRYLPPKCFQTAVLECPAPGSADYFAAITRVAPEFARRLGLNRFL